MKTPTPEDQPALLTLDETARRLSVCRRTLEREMAAGRFPLAVRIGRARRVPLTALEEYLKRLLGPDTAS
ncbi:DNA binding domain-containing protein, excisionase family [Opitutus sp. GAS368]|nr:DNA binding domain-containing protein, excisionase family [Opitutus sp. GAS368]